MTQKIRVENFGIIDNNFFKTIISNITMLEERKKSPIGIFDSGFGGLNILRKITEELPQYDYIYLGDTMRAPYGNRPLETIFEFTKKAVDFLFAQNCELIILACNTASSDALRKIQHEYLPTKYPKDKRVLGVIVPAVEEAIKQSANKKIGVIATESTVASGSFIREVKKLEPRAEIFQKACPLLVPIVEAGEENSPAVDIMLKDYIQPLLDQKIDTLILGCTHYGILEDKIKKITGNIKIISEGGIVAEKLKDYLKRHPEIEGKISKNSSVVFYSSDLTDKFQILGSRFFGKNIEARKAILD